MQDRIKVVIVDDEPQSIHRLQDDLATLEDFEVIATSSSAVSAKNLVMSIQPDVLFIDVEMPGQTGFEVLQSLREEMPMELIVVFYSAFDKYMIDALRASAFLFFALPIGGIFTGYWREKPLIAAIQTLCYLVAATAFWRLANRRKNAV